MVATCKSCGAPIVWIETPKHKWIPCDEGLIPYEEDLAGTDFLVNRRGEIIRCTLDFVGIPSGMGRMAHWATCPNAEQHRKRKPERFGGNDL